MDILDVIIYGVAALVCVVLAYLVRLNRCEVLRYVQQLVQSAEQAVQGSGMGAAKKALVIAQLEAAGIRVTAWLDSQVDLIVDTLNAHGAWLAQQAKQATAGLADDNQDGGEGDE